MPLYFGNHPAKGVFYRLERLVFPQMGGVAPESDGKVFHKATHDWREVWVGAFTGYRFAFEGIALME